MEYIPKIEDPCGEEENRYYSDVHRIVLSLEALVVLKAKELKIMQAEHETEYHNIASETCPADGEDFEDVDGDYQEIAKADSTQSRCDIIFSENLESEKESDRRQEKKIRNRREREMRGWYFRTDYWLRTHLMLWFDWLCDKTERWETFSLVFDSWSQRLAEREW